MTRFDPSEFADKRVLVTGGAGAIGSNLTSGLADAGAQVIVLDNLSAGVAWTLPSSPNVLFVEGDIRDEVKLKRVFFERPQVVYHLAAFFANQNSVDHPESDLDVNGMGTRGCSNTRRCRASSDSCTHRRAAPSTAARPRFR